MSWGLALGGAVGIFLPVVVAIILHICSNREFRRPHSANPLEPPTSNFCGICGESLRCSEFLSLGCRHIFHKNCVILLVENEVKHKRSCPVCRAYISESFIQKYLM